MKKNYLFKLFLIITLFLCESESSFAQVRMIDVDPSTNTVTIRNFGAGDVNVASYWFCHLFTYTQLSDGTLLSGDFNLSQNEEVIVQASSNFNSAASDLGLYNAPSFSSSSAMQDFLQWGSGGQGRENVAVNKGIWTAGTFIDVSPPYSYTGNGAQNGFQFWDTTTFSVSEYDGITRLSLRPNPASHEMELILPKTAELVTVKVYDLLGKLVVTRNLINQQASTFDVSNWNSGLYLVKITSDDATQTRRFIKQ